MTGELTPAEVKAWRERMGLSTRWLAERWGTPEPSVQRWERRRSLPPGLVADFTGIIADFDARVESLAAAGHDRYVVPRVSSVEGYPAAWHRAVALAASLRTGARLDFAAEDC